MPGATNPIDSIRTYFEDSGGSGPPVLVYPGFTDPLEYAKASPLASGAQRGLPLIFADHRGQGRSDKPHDVASYALPTRVADATAILDALAIERAHYIGFSWAPASGSRSESTRRSESFRWFCAGTSRTNGLLTGRCCALSPKRWRQGWTGSIPFRLRVEKSGRVRGVGPGVQTLSFSVRRRLVLDHEAVAGLELQWRTPIAKCRRGG
jgi:hypothetical protein